jgi:hypothetical protein
MTAAVPAALALAGGAAAVGGAFASSIQVASDFEHQMSGVKAVLAPDEVAAFGQALTDLALKLGKDTVFSSAQAADAIQELVKAGVDVQTVLDGGAAAALSLAAATGISVSQAAQFAGTALNTFHESADQLTHTVDTLSGVANASAADIGDLQFAFQAVGPVAASLGLSFDDTAIALGAFADNGLRGSDAGTSLKTMLLNLEPSTKAQISAFQQLGLYTVDTATGTQRLADILQGAGAPGLKALSDATKDGSVTMDELFKAVAKINPQLVNGATSSDAWAQAQGLATNAFFDSTGAAKSMSDIFEILKTSTANLTNEQKINLLQTAFGTDAVRAASIAASEGAAGFDTLAASVDKISAADAARTRLDNLNGSLNQMNGSFETVQITIGTLFLPVIRQLVDGVTGLLNAFLTLDPTTQVLIVSLIGITGAVAAIVAGFILLGPVLGAVAASFGIIGGAVAAAAIPLGLLAAAAALLYEAWQTDFAGIREVTEQVLEAIQPAITNIQNFVSLIVQTLAPAFANVQSAASPFIAQLSQALAPILAQLPGLIRTIGDGFNALSPILQTIGNVIGFLVTGNLEQLVALLNRGVPLDFVLGLFAWRDAILAALSALGTLNDGIQAFMNALASGDITGAWNVLVNTFSQIGTILAPVWNGFLGWLGNEIGQLPAFIGSAVSAVGGGFWGALVAAFDDLVPMLQPAWDAFAGWLGSVLAGVPQFVGDNMGDVWAGLRAAFEGLVDQLAPSWDAFAGWLGAVVGGIAQFVIDNMGDIWAGLVGVFGGLVDVLAPAWDAFAGWFLGVLQGLPQFVIDNMGDPFGGIVQAAADLVGRIAGAIDPVRQLIADTFGNVMNWVASSGTTAPGGTGGGTTPLPTGGEGGPLVSIGTLVLSSPDDYQAFIDLVSQAILQSTRRVSPPAPGANPALG